MKGGKGGDWEEDQGRRISGGHGEGYIMFITIFLEGGMQIQPIRSQDNPYYSLWAFAIH